MMQDPASGKPGGGDDWPDGWRRFWARHDRETTDETPDPDAMPLLSHLGELRRRLLIAVSALILSLGAAFWLAPTLIRALQKLAPGYVAFVQLTPGEAFMASVKVAFMLGIALAAPIILYQALRFILPGLRPRERRLAVLSAAFGSLLFLAGAVFAYYCVIPPALTFLLNYGHEMAASQISLLSFVDFCLTTLTLSGLTFECPLLLGLLSFTGLVRASQLTARWREAVVVIFVLSAVLTPSQDPLTMVIVAGALLGLFALSLLPMRLLSRGGRSPV